MRCYIYHCEFGNKNYCHCHMMRVKKVGEQQYSSLSNFESSISLHVGFEYKQL